MSYRAIYAYAWDIAEVGVRAFADEVRALGLNTVTLAGAYHAGKFLRPHGRSGKVYFPEDGTVYFRTDPKRYGRIKPIANSICEKHDMFRELADTGSAKPTRTSRSRTPLAIAIPIAFVRPRRMRANTLSRSQKT
jgi:hypothetical protein